ncbi:MULTISPECIES: FdtA/QdtA family cupin domain-containing protein [unclassified Sphingomonas]|nr:MULTISPECIES: FdtA/QdtA family cupin domain-containing protein [unclassified Sphingomonas]
MNAFQPDDSQMPSVEVPLQGTSDPLIRQLPVLGDHRGSLIAIEGGSTVPFDVKRIYYIFGTQPGVERGFHAHVALRQLAVCVAGSCEMILDDGRERTTYLLDRPDRGLLIQAMMWREMRNFSADAVLLVLADHAYDEADYIRDYDRFLETVNSLT